MRRLALLVALVSISQTCECQELTEFEILDSFRRADSRMQEPFSIDSTMIRPVSFYWAATGEKVIDISATRHKGDLFLKEEEVTRDHPEWAEPNSVGRLFPGAFSMDEEAVSFSKVSARYSRAGSLQCQSKAYFAALILKNSGALEEVTDTEVAYEVFPVGDQRATFEFDFLLLASGKNLSCRIVKVESIKSDDKYTRVLAMGTRGPESKAMGRWELSIERETMIVREGVFYEGAGKKPWATFSNEGTVGTNGLWFPERATLSIARGRAVRQFLINSVEAKTDVETTEQFSRQWGQRDELNRRVTDFRVEPPLIRSWLKGVLVADDPPTYNPESKEFDKRSDK